MFGKRVELFKLLGFSVRVDFSWLLIAVLITWSLAAGLFAALYPDISLGVLSVIGGNFIGGMWWFLIGMFLRGAARNSYQQMLLRRALEGEPLRRFMKTNPVTVHPETPLDEFVEEYVYKHHFKLFPIVDDDGLVGCVTTRDVRRVPRETWHEASVEDVAERCSAENTVDA